MTHDDVIRLAREAGFEIDCCSLEWHERIQRFAALVAAEEREACARLYGGLKFMGRSIAAEIRARGET